MSIKVFVKKGLFVLEKYAPEILTYGGLATMVTGTVLACKQTPKAVEIIDGTKENLQKIQAVNESAEANGGQVAHTNEDGTTTMITYSKQDYQKDLAIAHVNNAKALAKTYAVPAALLVGGAACVLGGHGILRKRSAMAVAALSSVMEGFNRYRSNVIADLGEVADKKYRYGLKAPETVETVNVETGEITQEMKDPKEFDKFPRMDPRFILYNRETCPNTYRGNLLSDLTALKNAQGYANDKLRLQGHVTVNEVRDLVGAKAIPEGLDHGWVIDGDGDGYVDFGLFDPLTGDPKDWVYELVNENQGIPIELNIDGNIKLMLYRDRNTRN